MISNDLQRTERQARFLRKEYYLGAQVTIQNTGAENGDCFWKTGSKRNLWSADLAGIDEVRTFAVAQTNYHMEKIIIASSHLDVHREIKSAASLEKVVDEINSGQKLRYLVNHRRDLPPLGKLDNAELLSDGTHVYVKAEPQKYSKRIIADWDSNLIIESFEQNTSFKSKSDTINELSISVDKNNFRSYEECLRVQDELSTVFENDVVMEIHSRKSYFPDPEFIVKIAASNVLYYLLKSVGVKILEKLEDKVIDDLFEKAKPQLKAFKLKLFKAIKITRNNIQPQDKPLVTIFEIPGTPYIELYAKTNDAQLITDAFTIYKIKDIHKEIEKWSALVTVKEINFYLTEKGKWKFRYLITDKGESIGSKAVFKERDLLVNRIALNKDSGFSIAGEELKFEKVQIKNNN